MMGKVITQKELADIQQPIGKNGYSNPFFDKLYGKNNNPYTGTERDRDSKGLSEREKSRRGLKQCY